MRQNRAKVWSACSLYREFGPRTVDEFRLSYERTSLARSCTLSSRHDQCSIGALIILAAMFRPIFASTSDLARYFGYEEAEAQTYNRIDVNDFLYMEKLGEGAFGKVVSVT